MSVELDGPYGEEGSLFEWRLDGESFHLRDPSLWPVHWQRAPGIQE